MKKKKIVSVFNNILTSLLFVLLLFTVVLVIYSNINGKGTSLFGYQLKTVLSGSMEPDIKTGSIIAIKLEVDPSDLKENDVITFFTEDKSVVTHRIVETLKDKGQYITKGDANNGNDLKPILAENIIGKYNGVTVPFAGYILGFATSNAGVISLLIIPGVFLFIQSLIMFWRVTQYVGESKK